MKTQSDGSGHWAAFAVWAVVNAVNLLQAAGFLSRVWTGGMAINHRLGYVIMALAIPAGLALWALIRARAGWLHLIGPGMFLAFVALMAVVDFARPIEFRSPIRRSILIPYLVLFFGAILLMGIPMYRIDRRLWSVTLLTSVMLLYAMITAMRAGHG